MQKYFLGELKYTLKLRIFVRKGTELMLFIIKLL